MPSRRSFRRSPHRSARRPARRPRPVRRALAAAGLVTLTATGLVLADVTGASARLVEMATPGPAPVAHATTRDGYVGDHPVSAFADVPAITRLEPGLREALRQAAREAAADGVELRVNSGWRSRAYQADLLQRAIQNRGSVQEARRWVKTPDTSAHVAGAAVDVGPPPAARWLERHGSAYGLCRVYANEAWHFERLVAPGAACPRLVTDAAG